VTDTHEPDHRTQAGAPPSPPPVSARMTGAAGGSDPRGEIAGGPARLALIVALTVGFGLWAGMGWLLVILALSVMIFLHELGHYLAAKWSGMKVTEFFLFFGPKVWSFRRGETEYGIKLIPVGAYVRIIGMNNLDEVDPEDEPRTYRQQSFPKRLLTVSAGSLMHMVQAFVLFFVVFGIIGVPAHSQQARELGYRIEDEISAEDWVIGTVSEGSGAARAGLERGDVIVSIAGEPVSTFEDVGPLVRDKAGTTVEIVIERDGVRDTLQAPIGEHPDDPSRGFLGVSEGYPDLGSVRTDPLSALVTAGDQTVFVAKETVVNLGRFFTGGIGDFASTVVDRARDPEPATPAGPGGGSGRPVTEGDQNRLVSIYGVARMGVDLTEDGMAGFLLLLAMVNISIGLLNMVPLLPLDGGHAAVAIYERIRSIRGRRHMADVSRLLPLTYAVFMFLVIIGVSSIYLDIVDPISLG